MHVLENVHDRCTSSPVAGARETSFFESRARDRAQLTIHAVTSSSEDWRYVVVHFGFVGISGQPDKY